MLTEKYFHVCSFPWLLVSRDHHIIDRGNGLLFPADSAAEQENSIAHCINANDGWSTCPNGFAVFAQHLPTLFNHKLVLYGLKVTGVSKKSGPSPVLSIKTESSAIEQYVQSLLKSFYGVEDYLTKVLHRSVHEVRSINADIKAAAEIILLNLSEEPLNPYELKNRANNIKALTEILKARTDFLDYFANPSIPFHGTRRISVYKKFEKTIRSLTTRAADKGIRIILHGNSMGEIRGHRIFEVIPYLIIENAIKYSPDESPVHVNFTETQSEIIVLTRNYGPYLAPEEIEKIFQAGFRSEAAVAAGISGFGIGLFFLKDLVERHHRGTVTLAQTDSRIHINGREYWNTEVRLQFNRA